MFEVFFVILDKYFWNWKQTTLSSGNSYNLPVVRKAESVLEEPEDRWHHISKIEWRLQLASSNWLNGFQVPTKKGMTANFKWAWARMPNYIMKSHATQV